MLDQMSREQLVSLLYDILRRLFPPNITCPAANISDSHAPRQEGQLVFDPTIDAWEHTGIYPQGYTAVSAGTGCSPTDPSASAVPQFGRPGLDATATSAAPLGGAILGGPPCTAFSRPWQPGYPSPQSVSMPPMMAGASQCDDPWAMPEVLDPPFVARGSNPILPLDTLITRQNRAACTQLCRCSRPCVVTRVGHVLHFCRICVDQRPVGEPRSGG